ncbi:hypothetical protein [Streptomyces californicus]|uniref:hypothetical protein n=1 Tax=Streptomyces californicus TaxID=67351 RepID=UPI00379FDB50
MTTQADLPEVLPARPGLVPSGLFRTKIPPEWRERCLADPAVRTSVARYVPLTSEQFAQLMRHEEEELDQAVAGNPHLSAEMVARFLDIDDPLVRVAVAQSRHVDAETREPLYALVEAARADGSVEAEVALPEEAWRRLDDDPELVVRRPNTPPEVLEGLVRAHGDALHTRPLLVDHPNFPRDVLRTFVDEPSPNVRYLALEDPELPLPYLLQLAAAARALPAPRGRPPPQRHGGVA